MEPIEKTGERTNALVSELLLIDAETALLFLDRVEHEPSGENDRQRRLEVAAKAYQTIVKFLPHVTLTPRQYEVLMRNLAVLRSRLDRHLGTARN